jgi:predicted PurR-regulated permease PerM
MVKQHYPTSVRISASLLSTVIIVYVLWQLQNVLIPLLFAGILSMLLLPITAFLEKKGVYRIPAIACTILFAFALLTFVIYLMISQIRGFDEMWPMMVVRGSELLQKAQDFVADKLHVEVNDQLTEVRKHLTDLLKNSGSLISGTVSKTTGLLGSLSLIPLYVFLMLFYRDFFLEFLYRLLRKVGSHRIDVVVSKIKSVAQNYMSGLLLVILIIGTLNTISLLVLGIPNAVFFGFFAAVLVLVPYIGVAIGSLLPIVMALIIKDSAWYAVGVAGSFAFIQFLEGNFITPFIVGSKVSLNSLAAIVSLLLFGSLWGLPGLVLALPITAIIKVLFDNVEKLKPWGFLLGDADGPKKNNQGT